MEEIWTSESEVQVKKRFNLLLPTENNVKLLMTKMNYDSLKIAFRKRRGSFNFYPSLEAINATRVANGLLPLHTTARPDNITVPEGDRNMFHPTAVATPVTTPDETSTTAFEERYDSSPASATDETPNPASTTASTPASTTVTEVATVSSQTDETLANPNFGVWCQSTGCQTDPPNPATTSAGCQTDTPNQFDQFLLFDQPAPVSPSSSSVVVQGDADLSFSLTMPTPLARSTITPPPTSTPTPRKRRRSDEDPMHCLVSYIADVCCFAIDKMWLIFIERVAG